MNSSNFTRPNDLSHSVFSYSKTPVNKDGS